MMHGPSLLPAALVLARKVDAKSTQADQQLVHEASD